MNNFELRMIIWKLINPVTANCDSRSASQWEKGFQLAVSGSNFFSTVNLHPAIVGLLSALLMLTVC